jgi:UDP-2-acetamido-3-amino-2,3-dideoxy-glucuronate N-acetyltransferase
VLRILNEAQKSLEKNGTPISLPSSYFVHPTASIDEGVEIGEGTKIWHYSHILTGAKIGKNCNIGQNVVIFGGSKIGNNVKIQNNVSVYTGVILEDDVFCGPSMVFTNVAYPRSHVSRKKEYQPTIVKKGATIGANATIVCGITIHEYAFVGAGAVVTQDVPKYSLVVGVPAKVVGYVCWCGERLKFDKNVAECKRCRRKYKKEGEKVQEI